MQQMLQLAQTLILSFYAVLPVAMLVRALAIRRQQQRLGPLVSFALTCLLGLAGGIVFIVLDRRVAGGRLPDLEVLRLLYFSLAIALVIRLLDRALLRAAFHLGRIKVDKAGRPLRPGRFRVFGVLSIQRLVLLSLAIPFVASLVMTCRPKVRQEVDPKEKLGSDFASVEFYAADGLRLTGWWVPALKTKDGDAENRRAQQAVLLCHGIGSGKEDELELAKFLIQRGFNVFLFDFRGCGESAGAFVTFGERERLDVLGAMRWVKANHAREAQKLFGIGSNTGAAALLAAATETEGEAIDAVVLYEPFARLPSTAESALHAMLPEPLDGLVRRIGLPLACLHTGSNLLTFAPAEQAYKLWPRAALLVHGRGTTFVPVWEEMELYQHLLHPKEQFWPAEAYTQMRERIFRAGSDAAMLTEMFRQWIGTSGRVSEDVGVRSATVRFLKDARAVPVL